MDQASNDTSQTAVASDAPAFSVIILTRNEEHNIAECLRGLPFTDDIVVLDSLSTDRTQEIARSFANVRVYQREFDTEYKQRNYALHDIDYKHPWVYICDADERVPADLARELAETARTAPEAMSAYRLRYKNMYLGRWIKHASSYPVWIIRLVRPRKVRYEVRETNVHPIVDGEIGELRGHFVHYSFNAGLARWFSKHNYYSTREAMEGVQVRRRGRPPLRTFWKGDPMSRRRAMKNLSYFLIGRGFFRFVHQFIFKLGFLDGPAGFHYCMMIAMYEYWIELKMSEFQSNWRAATDRKTAQLLVAAEPAT
jgi:glycosyltransferase involved in cell wall biosynthesis